MKIRVFSMLIFLFLVFGLIQNSLASIVINAWNEYHFKNEFSIKLPDFYDELRPSKAKKLAQEFSDFGFNLNETLISEIFNKRRYLQYYAANNPSMSKDDLLLYITKEPARSVSYNPSQKWIEKQMNLIVQKYYPDSETSKVQVNQYQTLSLDKIENDKYLQSYLIYDQGIIWTVNFSVPADMIDDYRIMILMSIGSFRSELKAG